MKPDAKPIRESEVYSPAVIEGCRRGERAALAQVLRTESPFVERVLSRFVSTRSDLEDLLQLTLEQAIVAFPQFRGEAKVRTWLTRIAVRTALHHLKSPWKKRRTELEVIEGGQLTAGQPSPSEDTEAKRRLALLREHLESLDAKHHMAFILFQVEGHSMEEVAALMDSNLSTTKSRVMWARRKLFARLRKDPQARHWLAEYGEAEHE
ncbi:MAG: RNA polymerase sigma factor [Myxococcales bacterium]